MAAAARRARDAGAFEIIGPAPCPVERIKNRWRWHVLLKAENAGRAHAAWRSTSSGASPSLPRTGSVWHSTAILWRSSEAPAIFRGVTTFSHPDFSAPRFAERPRRDIRPRAGGRRAPRRLLLDHQPADLRPRSPATWRLPREPRMDSALVLDAAGDAVGARGPASAGRRARRRRGGGRRQRRHLRHLRRASSTAEEAGEFKFMTSDVSREKPIDYAVMARLLIDERARGGYPIWVTGPALVHSRARADMVWFIRAWIRGGAPGRQRGRRARHRGVDLRHDARA